MGFLSLCRNDSIIIHKNHIIIINMTTIFYIHFSLCVRKTDICPNRTLKNDDGVLLLIGPIRCGKSKPDPINVFDIIPFLVSNN